MQMALILCRQGATCRLINEAGSVAERMGGMQRKEIDPTCS
jgi:hypothetical protein